MPTNRTMFNLIYMRVCMYTHEHTTIYYYYLFIYVCIESNNDLVVRLVK